MDLAKHTTGAPLTPAELQQRRDAARARWTRAGVVTSGAALGAAGGAILGAKAGKRVGEDYALRRAKRVPMPSADALQEKAGFLTEKVVAAKKARVDWARFVREERITTGFTHPAETEAVQRMTPVTLRVRQIRQLLADTPGRIKDIDDQLAASDAAWEKGDNSLTARQERDLRTTRAELVAKTQPLTDELDYLLAATPAKSKERAEVVKTRRQVSGERNIKVETTRAGAFNKAKVRTEKIEVKFKPGLQWSTRAHRASPSHRDISAKGLARIRGQLREQADKIALKARAAVEGERPEINAATARRIAARFAAFVAVRAKRIGGFRGRLIGLGIGAAAGALGGLAVVDAAHKKLRKAAPDEPPDPTEAYRSGDELFEHGTAAEDAMAERLARMFRHWKDMAGDLLSGDTTQTLRERMAEDLAHATAPATAAAYAGAQVPVPITEMVEGEPKTIVFSAGGVRGPTVQAYVSAYRTNKIVELTNEQMDTVTDILIDAARTGASPQAMAMKVREAVGLTANQAAQVQNYRAELEALDPAALERELRDKRFDSTVRKAIRADAKLTDEQITKMVDAYHRRYLAYRAMTIARTEGVGAANNGHMASIQDTLDANPDLDVVKTWIATEDEKTRPDHRGLDGQTVVGMDTNFRAPSGDELAWPHHPEGAARQCVNCRCTLATRLVPRSIAQQFADNPGQFVSDEPDDPEESAGLVAAR